MYQNDLIGTNDQNNRNDKKFLNGRAVSYYTWEREKKKLKSPKLPNNQAVRKTRKYTWLKVTILNEKFWITGCSSSNFNTQKIFYKDLNYQ